MNDSIDNESHNLQIDGIERLMLSVDTRQHCDVLRKNHNLQTLRRLGEAGLFGIRFGRQVDRNKDLISYLNIFKSQKIDVMIDLPKHTNKPWLLIASLLSKKLIKSAQISIEDESLRNHLSDTGKLVEYQVNNRLVARTIPAQYVSELSSSDAIAQICNMVDRGIELGYRSFTLPSNAPNAIEHVKNSTQSEVCVIATGARPAYLPREHYWGASSPKEVITAGADFVIVDFTVLGTHFEHICKELSS